jgi:hypothetical protein
VTDRLLGRSVCAAGRPACSQVSRCIGLSGCDREFPALTGRSGLQRARVLPWRMTVGASAPWSSSSPGDPRITSVSRALLQLAVLARDSRKGWDWCPRPSASHRDCQQPSAAARLSASVVSWPACAMVSFFPVCALTRPRKSVMPAQAVEVSPDVTAVWIAVA